MTGTHPHPSSETAPPGTTSETAVAVGTINKVLKDLVEGAFLPLWVRGEVSDFKKHRNGHWYFTLRDSTSQLRCVTWSRDQDGIPAPPDDGMQVAAFGQLSVYTAKGDLQFSARRIEAAGDGLWLKAFEKTKARLERDGLLAPERKRALPSMPRVVAVVTSSDGAALHDIIHVIRRRCPPVHIVLVQARVQGEGAARDLRGALARVVRWKKANLIIIGRGGGSREDLWSFNDEKLARAIAACPVPVISAVGHETDVTICDLVADLRAATPSAAAEAAVPKLTDMGAVLRSRAMRMRRSLVTALRSRTDRVNAVRRTLPRVSKQLINVRDSQLRALAARINDLSPVATMARGFSIAEDAAGRTLSRTEQFKAGQQFRLNVRDGSVSATVNDVHRKKEDESVL